MQNTQIRRNRILFALWTLVLLILFFVILGINKNKQKKLRNRRH